MWIGERGVECACEARRKCNECDGERCSMNVEIVVIVCMVWVPCVGSLWDGCDVCDVCV